jgi:hypothetical protein
MNTVLVDVYDRIVSHLRDGTTDMADSILTVPWSILRRAPTSHVSLRCFAGCR